MLDIRNNKVFYDGKEVDFISECGSHVEIEFKDKKLYPLSLDKNVDDVEDIMRYLYANGGI
jgi:hypothetical protein